MIAIVVVIPAKLKAAYIAILVTVSLEQAHIAVALIGWLVLHPAIRVELTEARMAGIDVQVDTPAMFVACVIGVTAYND